MIWMRDFITRLTIALGLIGLAALLLSAAAWVLIPIYEHFTKDTPAPAMEIDSGHLGPYRYTGARASSLVDEGMSPMEVFGQAQFGGDVQFDEVVVFHGAVKFSGPVVFLGPVEWGCEDE